MLWVPIDWSLEDDFGRPPLDDRFLLRAADGTEVPLDVSFLHDLELRLLIPTEELAAQTRYDVVRCHFDACTLVLRSLTTGDGRDDEAPPLPVELGPREDGRDRAPCGGRIDWVRLDIEARGVLVVDLGVPEFDERTLSGNLDIVTTERPIEVSDLDVGLEDETAIRVGAYDQAGNFSGWQRLDPIQLPDGCGCTAEPARASGLLPLLLLVRRRRARRR